MLQIFDEVTTTLLSDFLSIGFLPRYCYIPRRIDIL